MTVAASPWTWHAHPDVWLLVAVLGGGYWYAVTRWAPASRRQRWCFAAGLLALWGAADWPMHDLGERYLLSAHMLQHLVFTFVAPPLLMLGTPAGVWRRLLSRRSVARFVAEAGRPLPAAITFNTVVALSHWPLVVDASLRSEVVHFSVHAVLVSTAALMWFPVVNRLPEFPTMSPPIRMVYLFAQSILPTVPAAFLVFADGAVYDFYETVPRVFGLSVIEDQQLAGAVMKILGGTLLWGIIVVMFFRWYAASQRDEGEVLTWADVERELARSPHPGPGPDSR